MASVAVLGIPCPLEAEVHPVPIQPHAACVKLGAMVVEGADTRTFDHARESTGPASYILAIDSMSSRRIDVPENGILHVGRSADAHVQIKSEAVSRLHAKLVFIAGRAQVEDLGSHNGTLVNGERIAGSCPLASGDVVSIADTLLILRSASLVRLAEPLDLAQMGRRIDQEIARATDYDRPFSVVVIRHDGSTHAPITASLGALRPMDVLCINGSSIVALLPELDAAAGYEQGMLLLDVLGAQSARGGLATYPADGCDSPTLLAAARGAINSAQPGQLVIASAAAVEHIVGDKRVLVADAAMRRLYELIRRLARSNISVLVTGETGSGKENAAAALHHWSPRATGPFIALNCAAVPETLAESELFGYERGAFSDARAAKAGLFERANGGTVFLDEIGDLSLALQAKLLRALEAKTITRLGDTRERDIDVRVVAATNVDLDAAVAQNRFRQDLLFRLSAAMVSIPPLRDRRQEISLLAREFVALECERLDRELVQIAEPALAALVRYSFPGNVRELKNAMDFAVATTDGPTIHVNNLPTRITGRSGDSGEPKPRLRPLADELHELERRRIVEALEACDGVQTRAAAAIGMPLRTFTFRMRQYRIAERERGR
jgi:two-component system, NtrC family, response regulator AtoC